MQVYLPDDLYRAVKEQGLPASELLQEAERVEVRRRRILQATDECLAGLSSEVGEPTAKEQAWAEALARRLSRHDRQAAG